MRFGARDDRVPDGVDARREATHRIFNHVQHAGVVVLELVAGIAQQQRALVRRRQEFLHAFKTVFLQHRNLATGVELGDIRLERAGVGGVQFEQLEAIAVALAQHVLHDEGRAGIDLVGSARVEGLDHIQVILQRRSQVFGAKQTLNAIGCFAAGFGKLAVQSIEARTSVRVQHGQSGVFLREMLQSGNEDGVLEHIGVIACVKCVSITEHPRSLRLAATFQCRTEKKPLKSN